MEEKIDKEGELKLKNQHIEYLRGTIKTLERLGDFSLFQEIRKIAKKQADNLNNEMKKIQIMNAQQFRKHRIINELENGK